MPEWWTYRPEDFLLFSPRVYWRMFELHNEAVWPLQVIAVLLGAAILVWTVWPWPGSDRVTWMILAAGWMFVAWVFLGTRYATINWVATYAVPVFALQGLLLAWIGTWRGGLHFASMRNFRSVAGLAIFLYALVIHPFVAMVVGRPVEEAEIVGIVPDPTAMATLGLLSMVPGGAVTWALMAVPLAWCLVSWMTIGTMGAVEEAWVPLTAAGAAVAAKLLPIGAKRRVPA